MLQYVGFFAEKATEYMGSLREELSVVYKGSFVVENT